MEKEENKKPRLIYILLIIIILCLASYIVYDKFLMEKVKPATVSIIDFSDCITGKESVCTQNTVLDGKSIKLETTLIEDTSEKSDVPYYEYKYIYRKFKLKANGKEIGEGEVHGYEHYIGGNLGSFINTGDLLIHTECFLWGCEGYDFIDSDGNVFHAGINIDPKLPGMGIPIAAKYEILGANKIRIKGSRIQDVPESASVMNLTGDIKDDVWVCNTDILKEEKGLTNDTIIEAEYELTYLGNNEYSFERIKGTEKKYSEMKDLLEYCEDL